MGQYKPKVVRAKINIPPRPWEAYREELKGEGFTVNNFKAMQKADQFFNGLELYLSSWAYDHHESWHLWNWDKAADERVKMGLYHAEQFKPGTIYKNDFAQFCKDWEAGEYDAGMTYTFRHDQVEVLEVIQEEEDTMDRERVQKALNRAKNAAQRKRAKERATKKKYRPRKRR